MTENPSSFFVDKQSSHDLQILSSGSARGKESLYSMFNNTISNGGDWALKDILSRPFRDPALIHDQAKVIRFLMDEIEHLEFDKTSIDFMDHYLSRPDRPRKMTWYRAFSNSVKRYFAPTAEYYVKRRGVHETIDTLKFLLAFCDDLDEGRTPGFFMKIKEQLSGFQKEPVLARILQGKCSKLGRFDTERADFLFRNKMFKKLEELLAEFYLLDAYYAIASVSRTRGFVFPEFIHSNVKSDAVENLELLGLFHPFLDHAVANDLTLNAATNLAFVTGANMSGKSTLMKSVGLAVYMAHLGFPVPASRMRLPVLDGLITTINLPDDIGMGYSHFYSEVKRVKMVGEKIKEGRRLLVIFDEFFRGTNVKDAFEGSLRISRAFSRNKNCYFLVSTHIGEVANALSINNDISFRHFHTAMDQGSPAFDYRLRYGISTDHIGMWILENEGIFDLLEKEEKPES